LRVGGGNRWIQIVPAPEFRISYTLDNDHPAIGTQALSCVPTEQSFIEEYAPARTYGFLKDLGAMRKHGLALGGSLDNAIVVGKRGTLNGLRFRDEFVRHKLLDAVGDLALAGLPILGAYRSVRGGHKLNHAVLCALMADRSAWRIVEAAAPRRARGHVEAVGGLVALAYGPDVS
jgi:UDP-3-O-[3-hydroxymyristoyl] N-acetylglucosamine deacetylase